MLPVIYRRYYFTAHVPPWCSGSDILSALFCGIPEVLGVRLALQMYQPWALHAQLFSAFQTVDFCNGFQCCQKKLPWLQVRAALRCGDKYEHLECIRRYTGLVKWQQLALFYGLWPHSHYQQGWVYSNRHELFPIEQALSIVAYSQDVSATIVPFRTSCHAGHCCYVLHMCYSWIGSFITFLQTTACMAPSLCLNLLQLLSRSGQWLPFCPPTVGNLHIDLCFYLFL